MSSVFQLDTTDPFSDVKFLSFFPLSPRKKDFSHLWIKKKKKKHTQYTMLHNMNPVQ